MADWKDELRQKRREVILEAAANAFSRKGYQRATIREIADEAGIAPGTIYLYFNDKRDLILTIAEQLTGIIPQELPSTDASAAEVRGFIRRLLNERLEMIENHRSFFHALTAAMWTDDALRERYLSQVLAPIWEIIESFLDLGLKAGKVRPLDPQVVSRAMVGTIFMFTLIDDLPPGDFLTMPYRQKLVDELSDFLFYAVKEQPPETSHPDG